MRQLKIAKPLTPAQKAEAAAALQWLQQQPVPVGLEEAEVARRRQYQGQGLGLLELVKAGYRAGMANLMKQDGQPILSNAIWSWRVRQGVVTAASDC